MPKQATKAAPAPKPAATPAPAPKPAATPAPAPKPAAEPPRRNYSWLSCASLGTAILVLLGVLVGLWLLAHLTTTPVTPATAQIANRVTSAPAPPADPYEGTEYVPGYGFGTPEDVQSWNGLIVRIEREISEDAATYPELAWYKIWKMRDTDWDLILAEFPYPSGDDLAKEPNGAFIDLAIYDRLERIRNAVADRREEMYAAAATAKSNAAATAEYNERVKCQNDFIANYPDIDTMYDAAVNVIGLDKDQSKISGGKYTSAVDATRKKYYWMAIAVQEDAMFNEKVRNTSVFQKLLNKYGTE